MTEQVYIGNKDISKYISASFFALSKDTDIIIISRGNHIKRAIDVLSILIRDYMLDYKYNVVVGSETHDQRNVSTVEIHLSGTLKEDR